MAHRVVLDDELRRDGRAVAPFEAIASRMGLTINREKTRIVNLRRNQERLEFLGYQIGLAPVRRDRSRHYWRMASMTPLRWRSASVEPVNVSRNNYTRTQAGSPRSRAWTSPVKKTATAATTSSRLPGSP